MLRIGNKTKTTNKIAIKYCLTVLYTAVSILFFADSVYAQTPKIQAITVDDGLSQGLVYDIIQSRDGFMWMATPAGLNRYDGQRFKVYTNDPFDPFSIASNDVLQLFEDSRGWIWCKLPEGIDIFDPKRQQFFHLPLKVHNVYTIKFTFAELSDGTVLILNNNNLWRIKPYLEVLENAVKSGNAALDLPCEQILRQLPGGAVKETLECYEIYLTQNKTLLLSSNDGLFSLDPSSQKLRREGLTGKTVCFIGEDRLGQVWMRAMDPSSPGWHFINEERLAKAFGQTFVWRSDSGFREIPNQVNQSLLKQAGVASTFLGSTSTVSRIGPNDFLWITQDQKLFRYDLETWANGGAPDLELNLNQYFKGNNNGSFRSLCMDGSGNAWAGTSSYGLVKINPSKPKFNKYSPNETEHRRVVEDPQGRMIAIGNWQTIYEPKRFDQPGPNPWVCRGLHGHLGYAVIFDKDGNCWINDYSSTFTRIDAITKKISTIPWQEGFGLLYRKNGKLLSVGKEGLLEFDLVTAQTTVFQYKQPLKMIRLNDLRSQALYEDPTGLVWIFMFEGLLKASPLEGGYQFQHYSNDPADPGSLSNNVVYCVAADPLEPQRYLWVGANGGGLNRLEIATGTFKHYKKAQGLPDDVVYGILPGKDGYIWLSTNKGLCRFHTRTESTQNFSVEDGLSDNEFNRVGYSKLRDGTLIFGGVNGYTVFHPDSIRFNEHLPQMHIVGMKANNAVIDPTALDNKVVLSHDQNLIAIDFAALEFSDPSKNQYRYRLNRSDLFGNNQDGIWTDLGHTNTVQFAQLPPGSYTFEVMGSNNDGIWTEQPAVLRFSINPPVWATWWAYLLYLLLIGGLIWLFLRYQIRLQRQQNETSSLKEIDRAKSRLFANISHEFRTPLTLILGAVNQSRKQSGKLPVSDIDLIQRNADQLLRLINQILDLSKMEDGKVTTFYVKGDIIRLLRRMLEPFEAFAKANQKQIHFRTELSSLEMDYDKQKLHDIFSNLLSNALKFTNEGDTIAVEVLATGSNLIIQVKDNGQGIAVEDQPFVFDHFYQGASTQRSSFIQGSGIGLSLTRQLAALLGGSIHMESQPGLGSNFSLTIPIHQDATQQDEGFSQADVGAHLPQKPGAINKRINPIPMPGEDPIRVLIVEDTPDLAQYIASCLEGNYEISFAENGQTGIDAALRDIPDIVISDVMMPEKDGFELCQTLKENILTSHIPIILLTALADAESRVAGLERGADAYLAKPFNEEELKVRVIKLLELRRKLQERFATLPAISIEAKPEGKEDAFLQTLIQLIEENLENADFSATELYTAAFMSQSQLYRKLMALTGKSPAVFIRSVRLRKAINLVKGTEMSISEISWATGFSTPSYFTRAFREEFGKAPKDFRN